MSSRRAIIPKTIQEPYRRFLQDKYGRIGKEIDEEFEQQYTKDMESIEKILNSEEEIKTRLIESGTIKLSVARLDDYESSTLAADNVTILFIEFCADYEKSEKIGKGNFSTTNNYVFMKDFDCIMPFGENETTKHDFINCLEFCDINRCFESINNVTRCYVAVEEILYEILNLELKDFMKNSSSLELDREMFERFHDEEQTPFDELFRTNSGIENNNVLGYVIRWFLLSERFVNYIKSYKDPSDDETNLIRYLHEILVKMEDVGFEEISEKISDPLYDFSDFFLIPDDVDFVKTHLPKETRRLIKKKYAFPQVL